MLKRFACTILMIVSLYCGAQEMEWSNPRKLKGSATFTYIMGEGDNGVYLLRYRNRFFSRQIILERYREKLGYADSRTLRLKKARLLSAELINNELVLIKSQYQREEAYNELKVQKFDENIELLTESIPICRSRIADYYDKGDFKLEYDKTKSRLLVTYSERSQDDKRILHVRCFQRSTWKEIYSKSIKLSMPYADYSLTGLSFENGENAFLLIGNNGRSKKREQLPFTSYNLFHFRLSDSLVEDYALNDTSLYVTQPEMNYNRSKNELLVTGLYSNQSPESFSGYYTLHFSTADTIMRYYLTPFNKDLIRMLKTDRSELVQEELEDMTLIKVLPTSDGGTVIISEKSSISTEEDVININGIPQTMARNIYNFGDVLVMSIDSVGKAKWNYVINKNQSSMNDAGYYSSIAIANTRSNIYIIYNDQMRNNGDVLQYTINNDGEVSYKILIRSEEDYVSVIPGEAKQIAYNKLLLPTNKDRRFALLKLIYPN